MNDDTDKPLNTVGDDALEARITAWVLGEASSFEAGELEKLCAADPALRLFERRLRVLHGLVAEDFKTGSAAEWKLAAERRGKITDLLGVEPEVVEKIAARRKKSRGPSVHGLILALAACVVIGVVSYSLLGGVGSRGDMAVMKESAARASRRVDEQKNREQALAQLDKAIAQQKEIVEDKRKLLSQIIRQEGVIYSGDGISGARGYESVDPAEATARAYDELDREKIQLESQIETLLKYDGPQLMNYAAGLNLPENAVPEKLPVLQEAKREYDALKSSGLGQDHPELVAKSQQLKAMEADVGQEVAELRETLKAKLELTKEQASRLKTQLDTTVDNAINQGIANQTFLGAKNDYESSQRLLEQLQIKQISEKMQSSIKEMALTINDSPTSRVDSTPLAPAFRAPAPAAKPAAVAVNEPQPEMLAERKEASADARPLPAEAAPEIAARTNADFIPPVGGATIPGVPAAAESSVTDIVTSGNRSGDAAITRNNIDAILNNPARVPKGEAKGEEVEALTGTFSDGALAAAEKPMEKKSGEGRIAGAAESQEMNRGPESGKFVDWLVAESAPDAGGGGGMPSESQAGTFFNMNTTSDSRFKSNLRLGTERELGRGDATNFGDLGEMGRLAGQAKPQQDLDYFDSKSNGQVVDTLSSEWDPVTDLPDLARKQRESGVDELNPGQGSGPTAPAGGATATGGLKRDLSLEPALAQASATPAPAATGDFDGFVNQGAPIQSEIADESTKARFLFPTEAEPPSLLLTKDATDITAGVLSELNKDAPATTAPSGDEARARILEEVDKAWGLSVPSDEKPAAVDPAAPADPLRTSQPLTAEHARVIDEVRRKLYLAEGNRNLGKYDESQKTYEEVLRVDPYNKAARRGMEKVAAAKADYYRAAYDQTRAKLSLQEDEAPETPATLAQKKQAALDLMSEVVSADEPFSTFSLHVSDASFKLAQAAMERGEVPAAEGIRPEEFYNAFDYGDPAPASGEPVVCVTEQSAHPAFAQRNLLRIGVRTGSQGRGASTPLNLTLLLDHSGSMEREDRNAGLAMAVRQLSGLLKEGDTITVAGFSRQPRLLADRLPGARAQELNELIARTPSEGGTNLEEGLKLGEELAKRQFNPAAQNRVVLFTDGAANLGDARPEALQARIEGLRQQGIAFDAAGFGAAGLNDKLLERLTRNGNGRYYIVDGPEDADAGFAKQLAGAFRPAAENVKVQVRFNPARVAKYKLIGFEQHRLKKEDFRDDAVDAAEMAAEEAGNALYQIETLPQGEGEVGEVSVRFRDVASGQMVERTWTIPYDAQAPAFDHATPSIQLAGLAAFTAEKLRAVPMAEAVDFQQLGQVFAGVRARYPNSQPVADLGSMIGKMK